MATLTNRQARFVCNTMGALPELVGGVETPSLTEDASQTYVIGDPLTTDATSGEVKIQANADAVAALWGFARKKASGTTGDPVLAQKFQIGDQFIMNLESNGSAAAGDLGYLGARVNFNVVSGKLVADVLPGGSAAVGTKPFGTIDKYYSTDKGYTDADGVVADTGAQVFVTLQGGIGLSGGDL